MNYETVIGIEIQDKNKDVFGSAGFFRGSCEQLCQ